MIERHRADHNGGQVFLAATAAEGFSLFWFFEEDFNPDLYWAGHEVARRVLSDWVPLPSNYYWIP